MSGQTPTEAVDALRKTLKEREGLREQLARVRSISEEPIAIVGMACRFPGGISSPEDLWDLLASGEGCLSPFPTDRGWDLAGLFDPDPASPGTSYANEAAFLSAPGEFDADFFGISPREALAMDPQQRLLLECSWEALESAGIDPSSLTGSQAGVWAGVMYHDYGEGSVSARELEGHLATGLSGSVASGRISYSLGLEGPAVTLDTACSSSLVAIHLGIQALRSGECAMALAGGATVLGTPTTFIEFSRQRGLAPDGRSKSFADAADGVGWAEGVGILVLERRSDAERQGHQILALVRGSAINQDGASNGLTAPHGPSQQRVIRQALANAVLTGADVDAVEGHGTGTTLGDPIEAGALLATYGRERGDRGPLLLGSVKSNLGHTQAAAGVAGVIKTVLALWHEELPSSIHIDRPSTKVDWSTGSIELLAEPAPWKRQEGRVRRAGVSAFGISGTNAHLIVEEAPAPDEEAGDKPNSAAAGQVPLLLSARSPESLAEAAERLGARIDRDPEADLADIAFSLATTRAHLPRRAAVVSSGREEALRALRALASGAPDRALIGPDTAVDRGAPVFLFPGQGGQWAGMGTGLIDSSPDFASSLAACEEALAPHVDWSLNEILADPAGAWMERLDIVQPTLFAVMVSLARTLEAAGLSPAAVVGHSQGEIAAAHVCGALSLEDAALVVATRARAMARLAGQGGMLSVSAPANLMRELLTPYGEELSLAAFNGPASQVVSGSPGGLASLRAGCDELGIRTHEIAVDYAAHSAQIDALEQELLDAFSAVSPRASLIPFRSTVTGGELDTTSLDARYWFRNLRETVLFEPVLRGLLEEGRRTFVEVGPHPVLGFGAAEIAAALGVGDAAHLATLRREESEAEALVAALAAAHSHGAEVDWGTFFAGTGARRVALPTYPFQRTRYWLESGGGTGDLSAVGLAAAKHPFLGAEIESPEGQDLALTGAVSLASHPWLADHAVGGQVLFPGTAFLELALAAAERCEIGGVAELTLAAPLVLPSTGSVAVRLTIGAPEEDGTRAVAIHSRRTDGDDREWTRHAEGMLADVEPPAATAVNSWPSEGAEPLELSGFYDSLAAIGLEYGPAFQGLTAAWRGPDGEIYGEVELADQQATTAGLFGIHPALLDAALHAGMAGSPAEGDIPLRLPFAWRGVSLQGSGATALRLVLRSSAEGEISLQLTDLGGALLGSVEALATRELPRGALRVAAAVRAGGLLAVGWQNAPPSVAEDLSSAATLGELELEGVARHSDLTALLDAVGEAALPSTVIAALGIGDGDGGAVGARRAAAEALALVQAWLAEERLVAARLLLLTRGAVAALDGEEPSLAGATVWGLVRSAQTENPGRIGILDLDQTGDLLAALSAVLSSAEPQLALREGRALVPRLRSVEAEPNAVAPALDPERTVLLTGATGALGSLFARHLVEAHGARRLLLASRSGPDAPGADALREELEDLGAELRIEACDISRRGALEQLLGTIDGEHPLGAVIHSAGILDDATLPALTPGHLERVFAPKADAAWHLHELTAEEDLTHFVLFSSVAGTIGGAGQGNYAAANAFLDALAERRRAEGLVATSIAWGLWERESAMTGGLNEVDRNRMERFGIKAIGDEEGTALFDACLGAGPASVAMPLDRARLRTLASAGTLPPLFSSLVRLPARRRGANAGRLGERLANLPEEEREEVVADMVLAQVAALLGHDSPTSVDPGRAFKDMGFDSLAAVELKNALAASTGLPLQPTLVFDYPTPAKLTAHLLEEATVVAGGAPTVAVRAQASEEQIAIVGMACRYPGGVSSPEGLWDLVAGGADGISPFPTDRGWDLANLFDPDPDHPGTTYASEGGFIEGAADFDAGFFGISPREALAMDPQQRLLLGATWEALESAGIDPTSLAGTATGVFAGVMQQGYGSQAGQAAEGLEGYFASGASSSVVSGRVAYALGLEGPAMSVDTACSSSLVALHLAAQALRSGECTMALAGGVTVLARPLPFLEFSRQRGLAPDGRCKAFAEAADGTALGEGIGTLVLERRSDAERNGREILAILRGSAVNQDGASNGLTAPSGPSQQRVIRQALANARLSPADVDAVEAHGTGTTLGDPIEAGALLATYGAERGERGPLMLGSIKSNIGHTQAAAGIAGVIKMVMAMREGVLPRTLHVDAPSTKVDWSAGEVNLLTESVPWERRDGGTRRAGISSFGISGTNAHVIIEEPALSSPPEAEGDDEAEPPLRGAFALPLSAKTEPALRDAAADLVEHLRRNPARDLADTAYSLATTRAVLERRAVVQGADRAQLLERLSALRDGIESPGVVSGHAVSGKLAYLFPGQGAQRPGMGVALAAASPIFVAALDEACEALDVHLERPLKPLIFAAAGSAEAELLDRTEFTQPALFAIEVALFRLLEAAGLAPALLAGHSIGELTAAHLAEVLDLCDTAKLVAARGRLMGGLPEGGAMVAIAATEVEVAEALRGREAELSIAAINSPTSVVISGAEEAALEIKAAFEAQHRRTKRLQVSHAFHSPLMEPMLAEFEALAAGLDYSEPRIPIVSTVTGEQLSVEQATDFRYWTRQVRAAVRFGDAVTKLADLGATTFVEVGPDALTPMVAEASPSGSDSLIPTLRSGSEEPEALLSAIAQAHVAGATVDWAGLYPGGARVALPTYPFRRERFWLNAASGPADAAGIGQRRADHPLLASVIEDAGGEGLTLTGSISLVTHPWLVDHAVAGTVLLPGTAFVEMALKAGEEVGAEVLEELTLRAPMVLPEEAALSVQVTVGPPDERGARSISIHSRPEGERPTEWTLHAAGALAAESPQLTEEFPSWPPEGAEPIELEGFYERLAESGFDYGPAFQGLRAAWRDGEAIYAEVELCESEREAAADFAIHPALLDATLHGAFLAAASDDSQGPAGIPFMWSGVSVVRGGATRLRVRLRAEEGAISLTIADQSSVPFATVDSLRVRPLSADQLRQARERTKNLYQMGWTEIRPSIALTEMPAVVVLGDASGEGIDGERYADVSELLHDTEVGSGLDAIVVDAREVGRGEGVAGSHDAAINGLRLIRELLDADRLAGVPCVFVTEGAFVTDGTQPPSLAAAVLAGLVRSAAAEHPGRFALIDLDGTEASLAAVPAAIAKVVEEPQVALREGTALVARLDEVPAAPKEEDHGAPPAIDPERTTLITGASGGLGALFARHLVEHHRVRHLLLLSRSGPDSEGATQQRAELEDLGAEVTIVACDVSQREQLREVIEKVPAEHPLGAVIHAAGVVDDGVVAAMSAEQVDRVLAPKADGAWHLHELTAGLDLRAFVMFSSVAGALGGPGQANYAAANAFLDALAARRGAEGLPATSIAWGLWERESTMTSGLGKADRARIARSGISPIADDQGLAMFDAALRLKIQAILAVPLTSRAAGGHKPALIDEEWLLSRLAGRPREQRADLLRDEIRGRLAAVLGHDSAEAIEADAHFTELGVDSLASVELGAWLGNATGLKIPASALFDYPTVATLAEFVDRQLADAASPAAPAPGEATLNGSGESADLGPISIGDLYRRAQSLDRTDEADSLLAFAASLRDTFSQDRPPLEPSQPCRIAAGSDAPTIVCVPSLLATGGPHQYVAIARHLAGRPVIATQLTGYLAGEPLPADLDAALDAQAEQIRRCVGDETFVLLGHSTGGAFAHAVAERLQRGGDGPAALIKIDTYADAGLSDFAPYALAGMRERAENFSGLSDHRLTAMPVYLGLLAEYDSAPLAIPGLLVQATEPMPGMDPGSRAEWSEADQVVAVPGDHFTMMEVHAQDTAEVVGAWLSQLA